MENFELLTRIYQEHQPIRLAKGFKYPVKGEIVAAGNGGRCSLKQWLDHDGNYGIRTGEISGGFEAIDFDPKNYGPETQDGAETIARSILLMKEFKNLIKEQEGGLELLQRLVIIKTPSGGYHLYFKSNHFQGNQKLARNEDKGAFVETRGDGALVATIPTEGYDIQQGDIFDIPMITKEQRDMLMDSAKALTMYFDDFTHTTEHKEASNSDNPFVAANMDGSAFLDKLTSDGWTIVGKKGEDTLLRREGKEKGYSALFNDNPRIGKYPFIWNYSSSAMLESEKRFNHCSYLLAMDFHDDKRLLAEYLVKQGYGKDKYRSQPQAQHIPHDLSVDVDEFWEEISKYFVDQDTEVPEEPPVLWIKDQLFLTVGNVSGIAGVQKTGKSALANAVIGKMLNPNMTDFPSVKVSPPNGKGVLLIDTEQSRTKQKSNVIHWILRRAGVKKLPDNFKVVNFRSFSTVQSRDYLSQLMNAMKIRFDGLHLVIIDGGADFVSHVNNLEEVTAFMKLLSELCTVYECAILLNIHTNPSSVHTGDHKPTGHLGSAILKKSESVALIHSDETNKEISIVTALALRSGKIEEFGEVYYRYETDKGYHQEIVGQSAEELHVQNKNLQTLDRVADLCAGNSEDDGILDCMNEFDWSVANCKKKIKEAIQIKYLIKENGILKKPGNIHPKNDGYAPF